MSSEIYVCHSGTCRSKGSEVTLLEIEELVSAVNGDCTVVRSGCLGYCRRGPAVLVVTENSSSDSYSSMPREEQMHVQIHSLEASTKVVEQATGKKPPKDIKTDKFAKLRMIRTRKHARSVFKWNTALRGLAEQATKDSSLLPELKELLTIAGYPDGVPAALEMPKSIQNYVRWTLTSVVPVSKHSALYSFKTEDLKRGTPHPRGRGRRPQPNTWHTTLLAEVGRNMEGPLPWIERDYTPVSSAKDWEEGRVDILIKLYKDGAATSWLHRAAPKQVWLSKPSRTMTVPGLVTEGGSAFQPASVLLLLAGTGVVTLPQVLHHQDPLNTMHMYTPRRQQLLIPIDVILSFREDDVLHLKETAKYCRDEKRGVRNCTVLLTAKNAEAPLFPDASCGGTLHAQAAVEGVSNARILRSRLRFQIVSEAVARMPKPCRVIVSGPAGFNNCARAMLKRLIDTDNVTILAA